MAAKPKTGGTKKKAKPTKNQKEQSARFIKAAREIGIDESGRAFEKAMDKITLPRCKSDRT
jgi:hypothetical protein